MPRLQALREKNRRITRLKWMPSDHNSVQLGLAKAEAENGAVDIAVLNAGIYQPVNAAEFDLSAITGIWLLIIPVFCIVSTG